VGPSPSRSITPKPHNLTNYPPPDYLPAHVFLAATYVLAGRQEQARAEAAEVMRIDPQFSLECYAKMIPYRQTLVDQQVEALRKAGLK
jgi:adenylate cyclase